MLYALLPSGLPLTSGLWDMFCNKFAANPSVIRRKFLTVFIQQTTRMQESCVAGNTLWKLDISA
jgi:hypothetical protein